MSTLRNSLVDLKASLNKISTKRINQPEDFSSALATNNKVIGVIALNSPRKVADQGKIIFKIIIGKYERLRNARNSSSLLMRAEWTN